MIRNGVAPNLWRSLTAIASANSAVLLSRATVNCGTPTPRRGVIPGIASRPPCGAAKMTGKVPAQNVKSLSLSAAVCASAYEGRSAQAKNSNARVRCAAHEHRAIAGKCLQLICNCVACARELFWFGHFGGKFFQEFGRKRFSVKLSRALGFDPGFRIALLIV